MQGRFWEYHDILFEKQAQWQRLPSSDLQSGLIQFAQDLGLQTVSFESCPNTEDLSSIR